MKLTINGRSFEVLNITGSVDIGELKLNFNGVEESTTLTFKNVMEYAKFKASMQAILEGISQNQFSIILDKVQQVLEQSDLPREKKDELFKQISKF